MIEERVRELIEDSINDMGITLDSVIYEREGNNNFLRIIIDRNELLDVDTCVEVTRVIDPIIDTCELLKDSYILDVSSKEKGDIKDE